MYLKLWEAEISALRRSLASSVAVRMEATETLAPISFDGKERNWDTRSDRSTVAAEEEVQVERLGEMEEARAREQVDATDGRAGNGMV